MKTNKFLAFAAITTVIAFSSVRAAETLTTPKQTSPIPSVVSTGAADQDYVHNATVVGEAAKAKMGSPAAVSTGQVDPKLTACARQGKLSCPKIGTAAPCCQAVASCK